MAHAAVQVCSHWVVVGVKVVWLHIPHVTRGVDEAVQWIHGDGHCTPIVADEEAKSTPLASFAPGLKSITHHLEVTLYILDKVQDLVQSIQVGIDPADHEPHIDICDLSCWPSAWKTRRMVVVPLSSGGPSNSGGMNVPSAMSFHRHSREMHCMWRVHLMGQD